MEDQTTVVVLIVEDEPLIRLAAADVVHEAGYDVIEAANADAAIAVLEQHPEIRIVFTDIEMPGSIDGMKLAACIRDRWPPISIIVTSGRVAGSDVTLPPGAVFLPKPYLPEVLTSHLCRMAA